MNVLKKIINVTVYRFFGKRGAGYYSANQALLFFIFCLFFIGLVLGKTLESFSLKIDNKYLSELFIAAVKPVSDMASKSKTEGAVPKLRTAFLYLAGLEKENGWDDFYYKVAEAEKPESTEDAAPLSKEDASVLEKTGPVFKKEKTVITKSGKTAGAHELRQRKGEEKKFAENKKYESFKDANSETAKPEAKNNRPESGGFAGENAAAKAAEFEEAPLSVSNSEKKDADAVLSENEKAELSAANDTPAAPKNDVLPEEESRESPPETDLVEDSRDMSAPKAHIYTYTPEKPFRILMIGDSQMRSIAGGFMRLTGKDGAIHITEISIHSSGFIRSDYYNWVKKLENVFQQNKDTPFDAVGIFLGMNDYQNFYTSEGKALVKETPKWEAAYSEKIKRHLNVMLKNTKKVYWFGMPVVRNKSYNEELSYIERVQTKVFSEYKNVNLVKFSLSSEAPGKGAPYSDIVKTPDGKRIKLMRDDGVHYTIAGGEYIMNSFLKLLYRQWDIEPIES